MRLAKAIAAVAPTPASKRLRSPVFIIGCRRSGTSILHESLASHIDIAAYPTEANEMWHPKAYPWYRAKVDTSPLWIDPYAYTRASVRHRTPADAARMRAVFGAYQWIQRGRVLLNKSAAITFMIQEILSMFPGARLIHIVRDGRSVALSYAKRRLQKIATVRGAGLAAVRAGYDFKPQELIERLADNWELHVLEVQAQAERLHLAESDVLLETHYEEFCADPLNTLTRIAGFLDLNPDGFTSKEFAHIRDMNYKFEQEEDRETLERLTLRIHRGLESHGYVTR